MNIQGAFFFIDAAPSPAMYIAPAILKSQLTQKPPTKSAIKILNPRLPKMPPNPHAYLLLALLLLLAGTAASAARLRPPPANATSAGEPVYLWPLPKSVTSGSRTLTVDPDLALDPRGPGGASPAVAEAFERYRGLVFAPWAHAARAGGGGGYDVARLTVVVASANETVPTGRMMLRD